MTLLADRGFADQKLYALLEQLDFEYVIRFRQGITVTSQKEERRTEAEWVPKAGRLRLLKRARVTAEGALVELVSSHQSDRGLRSRSGGAL